MQDAALARSVPTPRRHRSATAAVAVCFAVRIALFLLVQPWRPDVERDVVLLRDPIEYHVMGKAFAEEGRYASPVTGWLAAERERTYDSETLRPPIFPVFVGVVYSVFGASPWAPILFLILLDTLACWLVFVAGQRLAGYGVGAVAAWIYALDPTLIHFANTLFSDGFLALPAAAALAILAVPLRKRLDGPVVWAVVGAAVCLALGALTKPVLQFAPVAFAAVAVVVLRHRLARALSLSAVFAVVFAALLAPWFYWNYQHYHAVAFTTSGGYNLLTLYAGSVEMDRRGISDVEAADSLLRVADAEMVRDGLDPRTTDDFAKQTYWESVAGSTLRADPARAVTAQLKGTAKFFFSLGRGYRDQLFRADAWSPLAMRLADVYGLAYLLVAYTLACVGAVVGFRKGPRAGVLFCVVMVLYFAVLSGIAGHSRFRLPAVPFYAVLAGLGWMWLQAAVIRRRAGRVSRLSAQPASSRAQGADL